MWSMRHTFKPLDSSFYAVFFQTLKQIDYVAISPKSYTQKFKILSSFDTNQSIQTGI